jgi:IS30 family transposase
MSYKEKAELWRRWKAGESLSDISRALAKNPGSVHGVLASNGGIISRAANRSPRVLSSSQREEISRGLADEETLSSIARRIGRAPSTVSREVQRNGGRTAYRAGGAEYRALQFSKRPKPCLLETNGRLRATVARKLSRNWSPQQVSGWLSRRFAQDKGMHVSHETIYRSLFIQARGVLKKELISHLRSRRTMRCAKVSKTTARTSIRDAVSITERPAVAEDRAVPGHWEGDLVSGSNNSHVATLVERSSRFLMLVKVEGKDTSSVVSAIIKQVKRLPKGLMSSLTWDRGAELASHKHFTLATNVQVYFCDPSSPWQRGTNENTNGLLRQYFPRRTDLSNLTQRDLDKVAREMNTRPRKTLDYFSPAEFLFDEIALTG